MRYKHIPLHKTESFSPLVLDYTSGNDGLKNLYHRLPEMASFKGQIEEKSKHFPEHNRRVLVDSLSRQYAETFGTNEFDARIERLGNEKTFTITTGHQLNLATGPLYFIYKIASAIHLSRSLKTRFPEFDFVPIYWMATEDHDLEEIQFFNHGGTKRVWKTDQTGPVGRMHTGGISEVIAGLDLELGVHAREIRDMLQHAYATGKTLADAQRKIVHRLFSDYELLVVDGDDRELKRLFAPTVSQEIEDSTVLKASSTALKTLQKDYSVQVNPREVNLFYIRDGVRERLDRVEGELVFVDRQEVFPEEDWKSELAEFPERFSPNVLLRPLYQETILPNLAYIGGGAEVAYWLELKDVFKTCTVPMPIVLLRNSVMNVPIAANRSRQKLGFTWRDLFRSEQVLVNTVIHAESNEKLDFSPYRKKIEAYFEDMEKIAERTEKTFGNAVRAQKAKQLKGLNKLEKRLLKAEKRKYKQLTDRVVKLKKRLFPKGLQERHDNVIAYYSEWGEEWIHGLVEQCDPLRFEFIIAYEEWSGSSS
jgi:bacillithiol biosynthesis cysteine-adding enzyme BshC